jgi:hypothetical protein
VTPTPEAGSAERERLELAADLDADADGAEGDGFPTIAKRYRRAAAIVRASGEPEGRRIEGWTSEDEIADLRTGVTYAMVWPRPWPDEDSGRRVTLILHDPTPPSVHGGEEP